MPTQETVPSFIEVKTALSALQSQSQSRAFDLDDANSERGTLNLSTRDNGSVYEETPGKEDIQAAWRLVHAVEKAFPNVRGSVERVDDLSMRGSEIESFNSSSKVRGIAERWKEEVLREHAQKEAIRDRVFVGVYPTGIVFYDRKNEMNGDYKRLAFLPFDTLELDGEPDCPPELVDFIQAHAADLQARVGQEYPISSSGQTVILGSAKLAEEEGISA